MLTYKRVVNNYDEMKSNIILVLIAFVGVFGCKNSNLNETENGNSDISSKQIVDTKYQEIFDKLKYNDSLLFELGFNQCDTNQIRVLTSDDFEFYHDQAGITNSKELFIHSISELCKMTYRPSRELDEKSLEVHILKDNGKIYGAIQNGIHRFYGEEENKPKYLTSTADFTHLWIIEDGNWKLKRVISYNHREPENGHTRHNSRSLGGI
jgi:hypothetical protein